MMRFPASLAAFSAAILIAKGLVADQTASPIDRRAVRESAYTAAKAGVQTNTSPDAAIALGKACFDLADVEPSKDRKAEVAQAGINACEHGLLAAPSNAGLHYYLSQNMGQLAQTKKMGALSLLRMMEEHWLKALLLDPSFDQAGPDRSLGLLYQQAPGWPVSIGSKAKAHQHLEHAVELAGDFPENLLTLIEANLGWKEKSKARDGMAKLDKIWDAARKKYSGPAWDADWPGWERRRQAAKDALAK